MIRNAADSSVDAMFVCAVCMLTGANMQLRLPEDWVTVRVGPAIGVPTMLAS